MEDVSRRIRILLDSKEAEGSIIALKKQVREWTRDLEKAEAGSEQYNATLKKIQAAEPILAKHKQDVRGIAAAHQEVVSSSSKMVGFAAKIFTAEAIAEYGGKVFDIGKDLANTAFQQEALAKKAETVLGPALDTVTAAAERNAAAMGLTSSEYVAAATAAADLLIPMGFQRDTAADISTNLVDLSGALSEWTGGQKTSKEVSDTLTKALLGEREELKGLGIAISEEDVKRRIQINGMEKATGQALEQAKAMATLQLITEKSADAQTAYAEGAGSGVRNVAELTAKFTDLKERIANALLPVFSGLISVMSTVADIFGDVADGISAIVDPAKTASKAFDEQSAKVGNLEKNVSPLLDRYDELKSKTNLSAAEQDELKKVINEVGAAIPSAVSGFDEYGKALGINAAAARAFITAEKNRLQFVNEVAIQENTALKKQLEEEALLLQQRINLRSKSVQVPSTTGFGTRLETKALDDSEITELSASLEKLQGRISGVGSEVERLSGITQEKAIIAGENAKKLAEETAKIEEDATPKKNRSEKAAKEREANLKELQDLNKFLTEKRAELNAASSGDELVEILAKIDKEYAVKLEKIIELEKSQVKGAAQARIAAEQLIQEEKDQAEKEYREKKGTEQREEMQKIEEEIAAEQAKKAEELNQKQIEEGRAALEKEEDVRKQVEEALMSDQELEVSRLNDQYTELLNLAQGYGIDVTALREQQAKKLAEIDKKYGDQSLKDKQAENQKKLAAQQALFQGLGELAVATGDLFAGEAGKNSKIAKLATLAQIAIDTASAISSLVKGSEAAGAVSGPAAPFVAAAAYAAGIARILVNVKKAKDLLSSAPEVPQKATGGWTSVRGQDDGKTYQARYIGQVGTGLLDYNHPVVLANEGGRREYFVDYDSLQDPAVQHHVAAIEAVKAGVPIPAAPGENVSATNTQTVSQDRVERSHSTDSRSDSSSVQVVRDVPAVSPPVVSRESGRPGQFADPESVSSPAQVVQDVPAAPVVNVAAANPVVLANEGGRREYFVDHKTLLDPTVLYHVRAIEDVKALRQAAFADPSWSKDSFAAPVASQSVIAPGVIHSVSNTTANNSSQVSAPTFVDHATVRTPVVFNHRQAIENVKATSPVKQMAEGGFTAGSTTATPISAAPSEMTAMMGRLMQVLTALEATLSGPIQAVIEDRALMEMVERQRKIEAAAGGSVQGG